MNKGQNPEYGLKAYSSKRLAQRDDIFGEVEVKQASDGTDHILLSAEKNLDALFPKDGDEEKIETVTDIPDKIYAPIHSGQVVGKVSFVYNGQELGTVNLVSTVEIKRHILGFLMSFGEWLWKFRTVKIVVFTVLFGTLAFVVLVMVGLVRAVKKSKRKKRRTSRYQPPRY